MYSSFVYIKGVNKRSTQSMATIKIHENPENLKQIHLKFNAINQFFVPFLLPNKLALAKTNFQYFLPHIIIH
jgi:hypothetical protein